MYLSGTIGVDKNGMATIGGHAVADGLYLLAKSESAGIAYTYGDDPTRGGKRAVLRDCMAEIRFSDHRFGITKSIFPYRGKMELDIAYLCAPTEDGVYRELLLCRIGETDINRFLCDRAGRYTILRVESLV